MAMAEGTSGDPLSDVAAEAREELVGPERELFKALAAMLAMPGFLLPLAAAQRQYRQHYYGMSAAALLEDVFFDTFANYLAQFRPEVTFERPERGQREWDYRFEGLEVSHKVGEGATDLAALWDATVTLPDPPVWTFDSPIVYLSASYVPKVGRLEWRGRTLNVKALAGDPSEVLGKGHRLFVVHWPVSEPAEVIWLSDPAPDVTRITDFVPFRDLWTILAGAIRRGIPANHLEVLRTTGAMVNAPLGNDEADLTFTHRAGISMFPVAELARVTVKQNNRAVLLPKVTVSEKMTAAAESGLFVPLPLWYRSHASNRPPDLYLAQRAEYDALFSPAGGPTDGR